MKKVCELYRHFDKDGKLLYVGISYNAFERLMGHKSVSEWFDQIVRIEIERFPSRKAARRAEIEAIKNEKPLCNLWTDTKRGVFARRPEIQEQRQILIDEAVRKGIKINKIWCLSVLQAAIAKAERGIPYPYQ